MCKTPMETFFICMILSLLVLPLTAACGYCPPYHHPTPPKRINPPSTHPPHRGPPKVSPPSPSITYPPVPIIPPITNPPVTIPPPSTYPPYTGAPPGQGGGGITPPATCPINALKLGLCVDLLGGLVHIGIGDPIENVCCPVLQGLLELEAAICLCTTIRLKLLNLNIFIPLALQVIATCGLTPPPGFICPSL